MKGLGTCLLNFLQKRPPHSKRKPISSPPFFRLFPDGFTIFFSDFPKKPFPFFPSFLFDYHPWLVNPHPSSSSVWSASQSLLSLLLLHYLTSPFFPIKKHFGSTRFFLKGIFKKKFNFFPSSGSSCPPLTLLLLFIIFTRAIPSLSSTSWSQSASNTARLEGLRPSSTTNGFF